MKSVADVIKQAKEQRLTHLDLGMFALTELPDELFELTWLESLSLGDYYDYWDDAEQCYKGIDHSYDFGKDQATGAGCQLSELPPAILQLKNLKALYLSDNKTGWPAGTLERISGLNQLQKLQITALHSADLSPLANLPQLIELEIAGSDEIEVEKIEDISVFVRLTCLKRLELIDHNISDISSLSQLVDLSYLALDDNNITDISVLATLTGLTELSLSNNGLRDISALNSLTQLDDVYLVNNEIEDISPLAGLERLTDLDLMNNKVSDLSPSGRTHTFNRAIAVYKQGGKHNGIKPFN